MEWPDVDLDFHDIWSLLTIKLDYDNELGNVLIGALKDGVDIILPTPTIGFPYLDKPDSSHVIGGNLPNIDFFNGFIWDFELHNIALPQIDIDFKFDLPGFPSNTCGPF